MKKTTEITKYEVNWQILRANIKNKFNNDLEYKFSLVEKYFNETRSYDRWERVYNWAEGLKKGFKNKNEEKVNYIQEKLDSLYLIKPDVNNSLFNIDYEDFNKYSDKEKINLFKDLFKRNTVWLSGGYFNKELNEFMDILMLYVENKSLIDKQIILLEELRENSKKLKCTYKFVYC